jgi:hypothetical protein
MPDLDLIKQGEQGCGTGGGGSLGAGRAIPPGARAAVATTSTALLTAAAKAGADRSHRLCAGARLTL